MDPTYPLVIAMLVSLVLFQMNQRQGSPVLAIYNRWLRWLIFGFGLAKIILDLGFSDRPYWALTAVFLLTYALIESIYRWMEIHALSMSPIPLFPRFAVNSSGDEWPIQPRVLKERDWLRHEGFTAVQSLRAEIAPSIYLRMSIYHDPTETVRVQVFFLPQPSGNIVVCASMASQRSDGTRVVTDNLYLPFAGFYPENWLVVRKPWRRRLKALIKLHRARVADEKEPLMVWETEPLADLNAQQHALEQVNTEMGFLFPHHEREENGKMTAEARYRVWKEAWLLNYFGWSSQYF